MSHNRNIRRYPLDWNDPPWQDTLRRSQRKLSKLQGLIEDIARKYGQEGYLNEPTQSYSSNLGLICLSVKDGVGKISHMDRRATVLAIKIDSVVQELMRETSALLIKQVDLPMDDGSARRTIVVETGEQSKSVVAQLKALKRAVTSGSQYALEKAWFGLTPAARDFLYVGFEVARRRGEVRAGEFKVQGEHIARPMLSRELLKKILPYAITGAAYKGRRPARSRDIALAKLLELFAEIIGEEATRWRSNGLDEPMGPAVEFIEEIERIFEFKPEFSLMPKGSLHALKRASALRAHHQLGGSAQN